jgi:hypothetical protein
MDGYTSWTIIELLREIHGTLVGIAFILGGSFLLLLAISLKRTSNG